MKYSFNGSFDSSFDSAFITLRELRELVNGTSGQKLPTAKGLRESGARVVAQSAVGQDGELTVYENGFFTYKMAFGSTVFAVDRCGDYCYDGGDRLDAASFEDEVWTVRLMLAGEDRLEHNNERRAEKNHAFSLSAHNSNWEMHDGTDFMAAIADKDAVARMLALLTDKQRQVVELYFGERMTQQQIAEKFGISKQAVAKQVKTATEKLQILLEGGCQTPSPAWDLWRE